MSKPAKARTIIVRLVSTAGTGFFYTVQRPRLLPKLSFRKFDPIGMLLAWPHSPLQDGSG